LGKKFHDPVGISLRDDMELLVIVKEDNSFEYAGIQLGHGMIRPTETCLTPEKDEMEIIHP